MPSPSYLYTPVILVNGSADANMVRSYIGIARNNPNNVSLSDADLFSDIYCGHAEIFVSQKVQAQSANGVPSITNIMAGTGGATANDRNELRAAVVAYICSLYEVGIKINVPTSVTEGRQTVDNGGIGDNWEVIRERALEDCAACLKRLTNWRPWPSI
jgi:hypothetical protein